jgi:hypothetical protein
LCLTQDWGFSRPHIDISLLQNITGLEILSLENASINLVQKILFPNLRKLVLRVKSICATSLNLILEGVPNLTLLNLDIQLYSDLEPLNVTTSFNVLQKLKLIIPDQGLVESFSAFLASAATLNYLSLNTRVPYDVKSLQVFNKVRELHVNANLPEVLFSKQLNDNSFPRV